MSVVLHQVGEQELTHRSVLKDTQEVFFRFVEAEMTIPSPAAIINHEKVCRWVSAAFCLILLPPPPVLESCNLQVWMSNSGKLAITSDLNQSAQLILGHPSGSGTRDVAGDLHLLHRLDVEAEVGGRGRPRWADVHDHQPVH